MIFVEFFWQWIWFLFLTFVKGITPYEIDPYNWFEVRLWSIFNSKTEWNQKNRKKLWLNRKISFINCMVMSYDYETYLSYCFEPRWNLWWPCSIHRLLAAQNHHTQSRIKRECTRLLDLNANLFYFDLCVLFSNICSTFFAMICLLSKWKFALKMLLIVVVYVWLMLHQYQDHCDQAIDCYRSTRSACN